jgi:hypothetical protein
MGMIKILLLYPLLCGQFVFFCSAILLYKKHGGVIPIGEIFKHWIISHLFGCFTVIYMIFKK